MKQEMDAFGMHLYQMKTKAKQKLEEWFLEDVPKLETIEAYKATMEPYMTYILE